MGSKIYRSWERRELGLGNTNLIPLSEARELAFDNLRMVKKGIDPLGLKRSYSTFEKTALRVHEKKRVHG